MKKNKTLKILLISLFYPAKVESNRLDSLREQAKHLAKAGHEVTLLSIQDRHYKNNKAQKCVIRGDEDIAKSGINVINLDFSIKHLNIIDDYILYSRGKKILDKWVESSGIPDIVHVHSFIAGKLTLWFHNKYHVPLVTSEYNMDLNSHLIQSWRKKRAIRLYRFSSVNIAADPQIAESIKQETGVPFSILSVHSDIEAIYYSIISFPDVIQASSTISQQGGICKVAYQMGSLLSQHRHRMTTYTSELETVSSEDAIGRIILIRQPKWIRKLPAYLRSYFKTLYFTRDVHSIFREKNKNPNCVTISHRDSFGADIAIGHSCHRESVKIKKQKKNPLWILNPIHHLYLKQEKKICNNSGTRLIAISTSIANEYKKNYGMSDDFVEVIPNGVDLQQFNPSKKDEDRSSILQELKISQNSYLILFVGNEFKRKGLEFILDALHHLEDSNMHLLVLGHANQSDFQKRAKIYGLTQNIHFLGRRSDAPRFFSGSDIFVIPADYEPFGLVGVEAMSCGTPILATELGGFLDYLLDGKNGYFIKRDGKDIAEKIRLISNRTNKQIDEMSINSRNTAEQYSWDEIGLQYSNLIKKTILYKKNRNQQA